MMQFGNSPKAREFVCLMFIIFGEGSKRSLPQTEAMTAFYTVHVCLHFSLLRDNTATTRFAGSYSYWISAFAKPTTPVQRFALDVCLSTHQYRLREVRIAFSPANPMTHL